MFILRHSLAKKANQSPKPKLKIRIPASQPDAEIHIRTKAHKEIRRFNATINQLLAKAPSVSDIGTHSNKQEVSSSLANLIQQLLEVQR